MADYKGKYPDNKEFQAVLIFFSFRGNTVHTDFFFETLVHDVFKNLSIKTIMFYFCFLVDRIIQSNYPRKLSWISFTFAKWRAYRRSYETIT